MVYAVPPRLFNPASNLSNSKIGDMMAPESQE